MTTSVAKLRRSLKGVMEARRYSITELANMSGLSYSTIDKFLKEDNNNMTLNNIERIADALDLTVSGLLNWKPRP